MKNAHFSLLQSAVKTDSKLRVYTLTLNPAIDYVMFLPSLSQGEINRSERESVHFGGKGVNVSLILQELGIPSTALGFAAGFTGKALVEALRDRGIATDFVLSENGCTRINVKLRTACETDINGRGPAIGAEELHALDEKLCHLVSGDIAVLSGSVPASLPQDIYGKIVEKLAACGVKCVVDATQNALLCTLKYRPFLIKPNCEELNELFGVTIRSIDETRTYAKKLQKAGAANVLVSMGGEGAILLDENGVFHRTGVPQGKAINTVGAGDSMVAGFLAGWIETHDYGFALRLGTAAGSATAFSEGLATGDAVKKLFDSMRECQ